MKRNEVLERLGFTVPEIKRKRVIIHSDIKCEADDQFAVVHHLLTPSSEIKGIIAAHFEWRYRTYPQLQEQRGTTMESSFAEGKKILDLMDIDDVKCIKGSRLELSDPEKLPESEGADFIIQEAMKEDDTPLYIVLQGCLTDLAIAYTKEPRIANRLIAIWIGGGSYPYGGDEANIKEDVIAARIIFNSPMKLWQIPVETYRSMEISLSELVANVKPYGKIGAYLCEQLLELNHMYGQIPIRMPFPHGETWCLGDNPTITVLLQSETREGWHIEKAPYVEDDLSYRNNPNGKEIRVYDSIDTRMTMSDLFSKLKLCY